ncbi:hypothetical protein [Rhodopila sp.]|uniref:hypothetical protein n=1 Tax=Rhodopila sp. TaxID=2480087 RepID=UPI003D0B2F22
MIKEKPSAILEIKIIDEGRKPKGVVDDWKKIALLQRHLADSGLPGLPGHLGALVCDVAGRPTEQAVEELTRDLALDRSAVECGAKHMALSRGWEWLFISAKLS